MTNDGVTKMTRRKAPQSYPNAVNRYSPDLEAGNENVAMKDLTPVGRGGVS